MAKTDTSTINYQNKVRQTLDDMMGKTYMYMGNDHQFASYDIIHEFGEIVVTWATDRKIFRKPIDDALTFIEESFIKVGKTDLVKVDHLKGIDAPFKKITDLILDNIKKVQKDPNYIPQAKVVNHGINTMLGMVRLKVEIEKLKQKTY